MGLYRVALVSTLILGGASTALCADGAGTCRRAADEASSTHLANPGDLAKLRLLTQAPNVDPNQRSPEPTTPDLVTTERALVAARADLARVRLRAKEALRTLRRQHANTDDDKAWDQTLALSREGREKARVVWDLQLRFEHLKHRALAAELRRSGELQDNARDWCADRLERIGTGDWP